MRSIKRLLLTTCLALTAIAVLHAETNPKPFVIPELKEWKGGEGSFVPTKDTRIVYPKGNDRLGKVAKQLADDYATMLGVSLATAEGKGKAGDIVLALKKDKQLGDEGYSLSIGDRVVLTAPTATGVFWGTRSLLQMLEQAETPSLPHGTVRDWPDYALRGFMIDCGRKFFPLSYLRDYVKIMAYYKMNAFHIHLNDNGFKQFFDQDWGTRYAAFRLESDTYPGLAARDGHYTKQEFIDLQLLAEANCVEVIPEIDIPAHSLAFTHYRPSLGSKEYGMDHLDLSNPEVYPFFDNLLKEYIGGDNPVFHGKRVHVGTDEYSNKDTAVVEQFRRFTDHYIRFVESYGKQACVWGALSHAKGRTPVKADNVVMSLWNNGFAAPKEMAEKGYKLISIPDGLVYIVPIAGYYYDYLNTQYLYDKWTPAVIANVEFKEKDPAVLGGMFAVWNDHVGNGISTKDVHDRTFPALQTIAAKSWSGKSVTVPFATFDERRHGLSEAPGVNQAGRLSAKKGLTFEMDKVEAGATLPHEEIGYDYRVSFDLDGVAEQPGTELFRSSSAVFYLADPIRGMLGFARDGYLNTFTYPVPVGKRVNIAVEGDNKATRLYIDGKLVETLDMQHCYYGEGGKDRMNYIRTLVFPLRQAGQFKSQVSHLKVFTL